MCGVCMHDIDFKVRRLPTFRTRLEMEFVRTTNNKTQKKSKKKKKK